jgi:hypothetical protein
MKSSGMRRSVAHVRTDISEERIASIIRVEGISELVNANVVPCSPILVTLISEVMRSSGT